MTPGLGNLCSIQLSYRGPLHKRIGRLHSHLYLLDCRSSTNSAKNLRFAAAGKDTFDWVNREFP